MKISNQIWIWASKTKCGFEPSKRVASSCFAPLDWSHENHENHKAAA